ncbi:arylesterase [Citreimonas salinaria]|uniref:Acyl-CoA thioesterase-1 n=1 Tax=Citreimonas salinaria TaxID=321339 RepID=A0A1H3F7N9_9RHOB|nr:arylesterase [Citreimonas salinaria]SDX86915.1 acyl-CoA thioesterase-1 [Citreimonas salinaria]
MTGLVTYGLRAFGLKAALVLAGLASAPAQAQQTDILALGDSLTQGYGLIEQEGFVPQLREWLAERGHDVRVVNAGVSGDTTAGGLSRVEWSLTPEIDAMIVALGGNDLLRGIAPEVARANLDGILQVAAERDLAVLLIGLTAPGNYGAAYKRDFDAMYPELAEEYDAVYLDDFFAGLRGPDGGMPDAARFMQPDGIHPDATGVARIVETVGPKVEELIERADTQAGSDGG